MADPKPADSKSIDADLTCLARQAFDWGQNNLAARSRISITPNEQLRKQYVMIGDKLHAEETLPVKLCRVADSLTSFVELLATVLAEANANTPDQYAPYEPHVYIDTDHNLATAVLDPYVAYQDSGRHGDQLITLALEPTEEAEVLKTLKGRKFKQAELIQFLRAEVGEKVTRGKELVNTLKKINFQTGSDARGEIDHGSASYRRETTAKVQGTTDLPESVIWYGRRWEWLGEPKPIEILLFVNLSDETFLLRPAPGALHDWEQAFAQDLLTQTNDMLAEEFGKRGLSTYSVFQGRYQA